jgi:gamma-glutamyltranspeptidase/glutathione hydrolase
LVVLSVAVEAQSTSTPHGGNAPLVSGRSVITTKYGIVAATQPMAAMSGIQILERGGNAIDAAIATNAVLGLMGPVNNGIGGDLFAIIYEAKTGRLYGLNSSGWAPKAETPELLASKGITKMPPAAYGSQPHLVRCWLGSVNQNIPTQKSIDPRT